LTSNPNSASKQYRREQILTASPQKLISLLYDGLIRFLGEAIKNVEDPFLFVQSITKAEAIIAELMGGIKAERNPEVSHNLLKLYEFSYQQLVEAHTQKDTKTIEMVIDRFKDLKETWEEAIENVSDEDLSVAMAPTADVPKRPSLSFEA
jgi:flagellar protein FliS